MTKQKGIILSAYTGYKLTENFQDIHEFIEKTMERPVSTIEMADAGFNESLRKKLLPQIIEIIKSQD